MVMYTGAAVSEERPMPKPARPIAVYHEHPDWFRPLFSELDRRGTPYVRIDARRHHFDVADRELDFSLLFNRMSPSAYLRGESHGIYHTLAYLDHLERLGARVEPLEVIQVGQRMIDAVALPPQIGRRAHAVEQQREVELAVGDVEVVAPRVDADVGRASPVQLAEQRPEPVRVLVVYRDGAGGFRHRAFLRDSGASIHDHLTNFEPACVSPRPLR